MPKSLTCQANGCTNAQCFGGILGLPGNQFTYHLWLCPKHWDIAIAERVAREVK